MQAFGEAAIFAGSHQALRMEQDSGAVHMPIDSAITFEQVFKTHYKGLHAYACTIVKDSDDAEEIVQQMFYKLWEKKDSVKIDKSISGYLYRAVYNDSLNHLKHLKVKAAHQSWAGRQGEGDEQVSASMSSRELEQRLDAALKELPEGCRTIFQMSRFEELKYREIADKLNISIKTVENQMGKALSILRQKLQDLLPAVLLLILLNA